MSSPAALGSVHRLPPKAVVSFMILPLFMAFVYPILFLVAFHDPQPRNMDLSIIETTDEAPALASQLESSADDDALKVTTVPDVDAAKSDVMDLKTRAAYDPKTGDLYLASASSVAATGVAQQMFQNVAKQSDQQLTVHDLQAPTDKDTQASGFMYMAMLAVMVGFMTALMLNMAGKHLKIWQKLLVQLGMGIAGATILLTTLYHFYGLYDTHIIQAGLVFLGTFMAVSVFQLGLASIIGQASSFFGIIFFILLGVPSSGAAMPVDMLPGFFRAVHYVLPVGVSADMQRSVLYFHGHGISTSIPVLMVWLFAGLALLWIGNGLKKPEIAPTGPDEAPQEPTGTVTAPGGGRAAVLPGTPAQRTAETAGSTSGPAPQQDAAAPNQPTQESAPTGRRAASFPAFAATPQDA